MTNQYVGPNSGQIMGGPATQSVATNGLVGPNGTYGYGSGHGNGIVGSNNTSSGIWYPGGTTYTTYGPPVDPLTSLSYTMLSSLATILGQDAAKFTIIPSAFCIGSGPDRFTLSELLKKLNNIPYVEFKDEIAIAPSVYQAIISYTKMEDGYAGLGVVDFLNRVLSVEK